MINTMPMVLLLLLAIAAIALILSARRRRGRLTGPVCGSCGYNVLGLATMTCPECGGDLRRVGILTPQTPGQPRGPLGGVILFTAVVIFVAFVTSAAMTLILPLRHSDAEQVRLTSPRSGLYREIALHAEGASYLPPRNGLDVKIDLVNDSAASTQPASSWMLFRPDGSYDYVAPGSPRISRPGGFSSAAVLKWMEASGIDTATPFVTQEAARIAGQTRLISRNARRVFALTTQTNGTSMRSGSDGGAFATYSNTQRASAERPDWPPYLFLLLWLAIWISGMRYLIRRWRPLARTSS